VLDRLEDFMNKLTDMDNGWYPVLFLRPAIDCDIDNMLLLKLSLVFGTPSGILLILFEQLRTGRLTPAAILIAMALGWVLFFVLYKITFRVVPE